MKKLILSFVLVISITFSYAQKTVAVLSGTTWTFYDDFSPALRAAPAGSTIYVPGGSFDLGIGGDTINRPITIIGVGHSPDSTASTGVSNLNGSLSLGSNNISLIGVKTGQISTTYSTRVIVENLFISRCYTSSIILVNSDSGYIKSSAIFESNINSIRGSNNTSLNSYSFTLNNCIVRDGVEEVKNGTIRNNIILGNLSCSSCQFGYGEVSNSTIENNYIYSLGSNHPDNSLKNNIVSTGSISCSNCTSMQNNYFSVAIASTFNNVQATTFSYDYDYHLKSTSVGKNAGTDGTDIGIYGSAYPYKEGAVPPNPHISTKSIAPTSASNGTLPVNIKVVAQDR